ncbi:unnamed protein product, partial [marine sediment metagenome]
RPEFALKGGPKDILNRGLKPPDMTIGISALLRARVKTWARFK